MIGGEPSGHVTNMNECVLFLSDAVKDLECAFELTDFR